jgi:hypothetical protein
VLNNVLLCPSITVAVPELGSTLNMFLNCSDMLARAAPFCFGCVMLGEMHA